MSDFKNQLFEIDLELKTVLSLIEEYRRKLNETQSQYLYLKIKKEKLLELLADDQLLNGSEEPTARDLDIERFRQVLPELMKKV